MQYHTSLKHPCWEFGVECKASRGSDCLDSHCINHNAEVSAALFSACQLYAFGENCIAAEMCLNRRQKLAGQVRLSPLCYGLVKACQKMTTVTCSPSLLGMFSLCTHPLSPSCRSLPGFGFSGGPLPWLSDVNLAPDLQKYSLIIGFTWIKNCSHT